MFTINQQYSKKHIYKILEVPKSGQRGDWDSGYHEHDGIIYIFANIGVAGRTGHDYQNHWAKGNLVWYSRGRATSEQPLIREMLSPNSQVRIFVRGTNRDPFTYKGMGKAKSWSDSRPVEITWILSDKELLQPESAWKEALDSAKRLLGSRESYFSQKQSHEYKIVGVRSSALPTTAF